MKNDKSAPAGAAAPAGRGYRRRIVVVKRGFQFKYAIIVFTLFALAAFMVWWEIYNSFKAVIDQGLIQDPEAVRQVSSIGRVVLVKVLIALGLVWFLSIILSHYLAGPIYRFEACLKLLKDGDLVHRAHLRTHDELKGLATIYNEGVESLQTRIRAIRDAAQGGDPRTALDRIKAIIDGFKI